MRLGGSGARFDAFSQPGGTFPLKLDDAVEYQRMRRSWQPARPHTGARPPLHSGYPRGAWPPYAAAR